MLRSNTSQPSRDAIQNVMGNFSSPDILGFDPDTFRLEFDNTIQFIVPCPLAEDGIQLHVAEFDIVMLQVLPHTDSNEDASRNRHVAQPPRPESLMHAYVL